MSSQDAAASSSGAQASAAAKPARPPSPVWAALGLPNFRLRLPSRNWMIFLGLAGAWTAAVVYDRAEQKRVQRKWARLVSGLAREPLDVHQLPRKLTVFLAAPPADSIVGPRDHFNSYVRPILVAAALDWDAVEGRREGDVRAGLAQRIRTLRKRLGEPSTEPVEEDLEDVLQGPRKSLGVKPWGGTAGDLVIGRHTWKEYVRGLHEGWLGPLDPPPPPPGQSTHDALSAPEASESSSPTDDSSTVVDPSPEKSKDTRKRKKQPPPFNVPADYSTAPLSSNCPAELTPSITVPIPHLLGFLNFPIRIYRFLNRRTVADDVGRQTAAAVLAAYRPFQTSGEPQPTDGGYTRDGNLTEEHSKWEQERLLLEEEDDWHKSVREAKDDGSERLWLEDMALDPRIAQRMRKFELDSEAEERAKAVATTKDGSWWASIWPSKESRRKADQEGD